jgi:hypothetical protein
MNSGGISFRQPTPSLKIFVIFLHVFCLVFRNCRHLCHAFLVIIEITLLQRKFLLYQHCSLLVSSPLQTVVRIFSEFLDLIGENSGFFDDQFVDFAGLIDISNLSAKRESIVLGLISGELLQDRYDLADYSNFLHVVIVEVFLKLRGRLLGFAGVKRNLADFSKASNIAVQGFLLFPISEI